MSPIDSVKTGKSVKSGKEPWRIAARSSDLAKLQAYLFAEQLRKLDSRTVEFNFRESLGDQNQNDPLWKMPEKGVFTEDFVADLKENRADFVVHSFKDLPTDFRTDTEVAATLPRADARDLLLVRRDRLEKITTKQRIDIFTSSPRRAHNLSDFFSNYMPFAVNEAVFHPVRGNIPTRLRKYLEGDGEIQADAIIIAKAAIDRLLASRLPEFAPARAVVQKALRASQYMVLPLTLNPTAAAQGALAIEIATGAEAAGEIADRISCHQTMRAVHREREILSGHGGGCHQKIGVSVLYRYFGELTFVRGLTDAGKKLDEISLASKYRPIEKISMAEVFPRPDENASDLFFSREDLPYSSWREAEYADFLWVARDSAWPDKLRAKPDAIIWCAGLKTWARLAKRGIWVNGCAESLGEEEDPRLDELIRLRATPIKKLIKLTHADSTAENSHFRTLPTYRLKPVPTPADLQGRTHFYWTSGSAFLQAAKANPGIAEARHFSGPGSTHHALRTWLGEKAEVGIYLSLADFHRAIGEKS